ncbi:MAG: biopolymer transporter ExbD [Planctomycetaceae bacterium]|nr:biopolymer transporter ExbD [Planctomycetota bacterium]NUN52400.1 biopolymer transporter ExbD [Planctomycetaceae bacterium]
MAKRVTAEQMTEGLEMNMTPMIDIVFQLIIFLMLANDMSRKEIEELELPIALNAQEDKGDKEKYRLIVNLIKNEGDAPPTLKVRGEMYDLNGFQQLLIPESERSREPEDPRASDLFILVRADTKSRWQDVQWVMQACADPKIRVYKLQFATTKPPEPGQ